MHEKINQITIFPLFLFRHSISSSRSLRDSTSMLSTDISSPPSTFSSYLPPEMHSQYMTPQSYSPATLPRRLPSQMNSSTLSSDTKKYVAASPATHRKDNVRSFEPNVAKDFICPPSYDRKQSSSLNYLRSSSTSLNSDSVASSNYPSALSTSDYKDKTKDRSYSIKPTIVISAPSYTNKVISTTRSLTTDVKYNSLPRRNSYRASTSGYSTPSSSYSSSSYQERASSTLPSYKIISPHSFSSYYSPKVTPSLPVFEESKSRRRYLTKSEAALSRPSERPW